MARNRVPPNYVSLNEAARMLGISGPTTGRLVTRGKLAAVRRNRRVWVAVESIQARLADRERLEHDCLTIEEVADFFGVHRETVRVWHLKGLLPAESIEATLCFDTTDVVTFRPPPGGRNPVRVPTRTLRGVHYPASAERQQPTSNEGNTPNGNDHEGAGAE